MQLLVGDGFADDRKAKHFLRGCVNKPNAMMVRQPLSSMRLSIEMLNVAI